VGEAWGGSGLADGARVWIDAGSAVLGVSLSVVAITSAKVGPFDLGTVVVCEALGIDPVAA
jgi:hypothetical protein